MDILGVRVDNLGKKEILEKIESFLSGNKLSQIATINPEFILEAQKDNEFKNILNSCDLNVADGIGIKFTFWRYGQKLKTRIAGVDLMEEILKMASNRGLGVFLVANKNGLSDWEEISLAIKKMYPDIKIGGVNMNFNDPGENQKSKIKNQNIGDYDIVFCSFGAPYQEKFIYSLKQGNYGSPPHLSGKFSKKDPMCYNTSTELSGNTKLEQERWGGKIKLAMGVGGSFDFLTGKIRRAPFFLRKIGLEWLFRLIQQPKRIKRIFNAVIIFPIKVIFNNK